MHESLDLWTEYTYLQGPTLQGYFIDEALQYH